MQSSASVRPMSASRRVSAAMAICCLHALFAGTGGSALAGPVPVLLARLPTPADAIAPSHVAFSPDGRLIVTACGRELRLWDAVRLAPATPPLRDHGSVTHASFSPDGRRVLTAGADGTAKVRDAATGRPLHVLCHGTAGTKGIVGPDGTPLLVERTPFVWSAAFSGDGRVVATAGEDATARLWDAETGRLLFALRHESPVKTALLSPDGKRVLTKSQDRAQDGVGMPFPSQNVHVWDSLTGRELWRREGLGTTKIRSVAFSHDGSKVVAATGTVNEDGATRWDVTTWDAIRGEKLASFEVAGDVGAPRSAAFSPDGQRILVVGELSASVIGAAAGHPISAIRYRGRSPLAILSPRGDYVLSSARGEKVAL